MGQVFEAMDVGDCGPVAIKVIKGREAMSEAARIRFVREARAAGLLQHPNIVAVRDIGQVRGALYIVMDVGDCGPVAIKVIKGREAMSEAARIRFVREARAAGLLQHPNIVAVRDIGQVRGALYIVMEYLGGLPLTTFIPGPPTLSLKAKLSILAQTADALGHAHSQGVVHRDVKPGNIMILGEGSVKMVDFGIAELAGLPNSVGGTLPYMSPEQLAGQTDLESLTPTLFGIAS